jgi:Nickel responsive protein SCO4226-like
MPRYIIERNVGEVTDEQLQASGRLSNQVIAEMDGVVWIRSYVSREEGKIYCEYDAPSEEAVREHARRAGLPADKISRIELEVSPSMFV